MSNFILGLNTINVISGLCWGTGGSSQIPRKYAMWAVQLVCCLRRACIPRLTHGYLFMTHEIYCVKKKVQEWYKMKTNHMPFSVKEHLKKYVANSKDIIKKQF